MSDVVQKQMPQYQCHKRVRALKIKMVVFDANLAVEQGRETDGTALLCFEGDDFVPIKVSREYVTRHQPKPEGYYVVYKGGYESWSPAEEFEEGYTKIESDTFVDRPTELAAQCWCDPTTSHIIFDPILAKVIAEKINEYGESLVG